MRYRGPIQSLELEVDLRVIADPGQRTDDLLGMFGNLGRGEGFVFIDDQPPADGLRAFQELYPGEFDWYPLTEAHPWRVLLTRRVARLSPLRRMVDFMTSDHRRMELMLIRMRELAENGDWRRAARLAGFVHTGARRHIQAEEEVLFPVLADSAGQSPVELPELQQDHRQLLRSLDRVQLLSDDAVSSWPPSSTVEREVAHLAGELLRSFFRHEAKEDRLVYAQTDLMLGQRTEGLVRRCQEI